MKKTDVFTHIKIVIKSIISISINTCFLINSSLLKIALLKNLVKTQLEVK